LKRKTPTQQGVKQKPGDNEREGSGGSGGGGFRVAAVQVVMVVFLLLVPVDPTVS